MAQTDSGLTRSRVPPRSMPPIFAGFRARFHLREGLIYLDGNSLGPAPKAALAEFERAINQKWAEDLITSWNTAGWFELPVRCGDLIARIIGADAGEVAACDTDVG